MEFGVGDVGGLGKGAGGYFVGLGLVILLDGEVDVAGGELVLEREGKLDAVGLVRFGIGLERDG